MLKRTSCCVGSGGASSNNKVNLLYSSKVLDELVFRSSHFSILSLIVKPIFIMHFNLLTLGKKSLFPCRDEINLMSDKNFTKTFFITKDAAVNTANLLCRRLSRADIVQALSDGDPSRQTFCFICGPNQMILDVCGWLKEAGLLPENIFYELWW